jgi:hypothetical protein
MRHPLTTALRRIPLDSAVASGAASDSGEADAAADAAVLAGVGGGKAEDCPKTHVLLVFS